MNLTKFFSWTFFLIVIFILIFFSSFITFLTDLWWFQEVGFTDIFIKSFTAKAIIGFGTGLIALIFLLLNILLASHAKIPWMTHIPASVFGQPITINQRFVRRISILGSLFIAFITGLIASTQWQDVLKFFSTTSFGKVDPLFSKDVSFYVFELPVYTFFIGVLKVLIIISFIGCLLIYILRHKFTLATFLEKLTGANPKKSMAGFMRDNQDIIDPKARLHLGGLGALFLITIAGSTYLSLFNLLTISSGPVFGAAFINTNVGVPLIYISTGVYVLAAVFALVYGVSGRIAPLTLVFGLTVVMGVVSAFLPPIVQRLIVAPNELVKETPFIKHNIEATRQAYGLDNVTERKIVADKPLTAEDIANNNATIKNVRLWDRDQLLSTFSQIQEIRTYYEFASVDNDRYTINGEPRQVMLSPRELASESLPNKNWINEHLTFTHGYGIAAGPVNQSTQEGLPVLFVKDLPPKTEVKELAINRPEMYYGELTNKYVIVKSKSKEFDYPKGEENVYSTYKGSGGVVIDSPLKKLVYSIHFSSLKMLLSGDITPDSRVMYGRNVRERVEKIAPFLTFDNDPYLVVADGKLSWIFDAYTLTGRYPYSQQVAFNTQNINYIRNSVKAVVDAYDGKVTFYQADMNDPIIKTYTKIFPTTFRPLSEMPKSLLSHVRYPEDIFTLQTEIYTTYHMDDTQIFYNKEDQWEVPVTASETTQTTTNAPAMSPRHMIMKLPEEQKAEYILMLPFTPRAKDNLSAWMVARNDSDQYGKLVVYSFPKDKLVYGPKQIIGRINQDSEISRQISLWDQRGSQVIQGPLLVIPIEKSLVYVRPLYLKAESGKIPELKRVIVAYENKIAMEATLEEGLSKILGSSSNTTPTPAQPTTNSQTEPSTPPATADNAELLQQARESYEAAIAAQKEGDWAKYGEEIQKLGDVIDQLNR